MKVRLGVPKSQITDMFSFRWHLHRCRRQWFDAVFLSNDCCIEVSGGPTKQSAKLRRVWFPIKVIYIHSVLTASSFQCSAKLRRQLVSSFDPASENGKHANEKFWAELWSQLDSESCESNYWDVGSGIPQTVMSMQCNKLFHFSMGMIWQFIESALWPFCRNSYS